MTRAAALLGALLLLGAGVVVYVLAVRTGTGQDVDASAFAGLPALGARVQRLADIDRTRVLLGLVGLDVLAGCLALWQRRYADVAAAVAVPAISCPLAIALKQALGRPGLGDHGYAWNTFPSGHATVSTSLVIALYLLLPWPLRGLAARLVLAAVTAAVGASAYISRAHRPSDVVGAILLVGAVGAVASAFAVPPSRHDWGFAWAPGLLAAISVVLTMVSVELVRQATGDPSRQVLAHWPLAAVLAASTAAFAVVARPPLPAPRRPALSVPRPRAGTAPAHWPMPPASRGSSRPGG